MTRKCTHRKLQQHPLVSRFYRCVMCGQYIPKESIKIKRVSK